MRLYEVRWGINNRDSSFEPLKNDRYNAALELLTRPGRPTDRQHSQPVRDNFCDGTMVRRRLRIPIQINAKSRPPRPT